MLSVRLTLLHPLPDAEEEMLSLLQELNDHLGSADGLLLSVVVREHGTLGRLAVWESSDAANREAVSHHVLALRARIRTLTQAVVAEDLLQVASGWTTGLPIPGIAIPAA
jgi:quinol monooxygenase YgiN